MSANDIAREKLQLIEWVIRQEKPQNLKDLSAAIQRIDKESAESVQILGYRTKGISVTLNQLVLSVKNSLDEIARGEEISLQDLEQDSDQW